MTLVNSSDHEGLPARVQEHKLNICLTLKSDSLFLEFDLHTVLINNSFAYSKNFSKFWLIIKTTFKKNTGILSL